MDRGEIDARIEQLKAELADLEAERKSMDDGDGPDPEGSADDALDQLTGMLARLDKVREALVSAGGDMVAEVTGTGGDYMDELDEVAGAIRDGMAMPSSAPLMAWEARVQHLEDVARIVGKESGKAASRVARKSSAHSLYA